MSAYELSRDTAAGSPVSWWDIAADTLSSQSTSHTFVAIILPWLVAMLWALYYLCLKRPSKVDAEDMAPFVTFYTELTAGATPGFDQKFMKLFHPALLKEGGGVERGIIRAMAQCTKAQFGRMTHISRETIALKRVGMQVTGVALVDFEKANKVKCKLTWVSRLPSVKHMQLEAEGLSPHSPVSGIRRADRNSFHVTAFSVEPRTKDQLDVLRFLEPSEFEGFADSFVERLFAKPPSAAVAMMCGPLRSRYTEGEKMEQFQASVARVVESCGGLKDPDIDATLIACELKKKNATKNTSALTEVDGVDFRYHIGGRTRNMEVHVRLVFDALRCWVGQYQLRGLPDERTQVVLDTETGQSTVV